MPYVYLPLAPAAPHLSKRHSVPAHCLHAVPSALALAGISAGCPALRPRLSPTDRRPDPGETRWLPTRHYHPVELRATVTLTLTPFDPRGAHTHTDAAQHFLPSSWGRETYKNARLPLNTPYPKQEGVSRPRCAPPSPTGTLLLWTPMWTPMPWAPLWTPRGRCHARQMT